MEIIRPDPLRNQQANRAYAQVYAAAHRAAGLTLEARLAIEDLILLDGLLRNYRLLDVGCATGGYLRFLRNHKMVIGLDFSAPTIDLAREIQNEFGIERVEYLVSRFEDFTAKAGTFDAVRLRGTYGAYQPWARSVGAIDITQKLLVSGGIAIASYYEPTNIFHRLKANVLPARTLAIMKRDFERLWKERGFDYLFDIRLSGTIITFWRKL